LKQELPELFAVEQLYNETGILKIIDIDGAFS
jgi:hypothetical protein